MVSIADIDVSGLQSTLTSLGQIQERSTNWGKAVGLSVALLVQADVDERFNTAPAVRSSGKVYGGVTWSRLTEAYLKANKRRESGKQLRDTGELLQSFQVNATGNVFRASGRSVTVGSNLPKAAGLNAKRPLLFIHPELSEGVKRIIENYIVNGK